MAGEQNGEKELAAVWDALAETVAGSSDQEILAQIREQGLDPHDEAVRVRMLLRDALKSRQQAKLRQAEEQYTKRILEINETHSFMPETPEGRRSLLDAVFSWKPEIRSALLTAQHRDLESYTDSDIKSCLKQLDYLGVLKKISGSDGKKQ